MSDVFVDMGEVYERAKKVARAAVVASPGGSYGLEDVMTENEWLTVTANQLMSFVPVNATLNGCIEALRVRRVTAADVAAVERPPLSGTEVTEEDMGVARSWLADTLAGNVNEDGRLQMIDREAVDRQWIGNPIRVTSLVLALVAIAGEAADRGDGQV